jgi:preprotein translocase subunit YajC
MPGYADALKAAGINGVMNPGIALFGGRSSPYNIFLPKAIERQKKVIIEMVQPILMLQATPSQNPYYPLVMLVVMGVIFYLLVFMPMKKRQKKLETLITALKNGDKVITNSGIYGVIAGVNEKTFILKVADQVKIEVSKNAIAGPQPE